MKKIGFLIFLLGISSCEQFKQKNRTEQQLLQEELSKINWKEVDAFPTVLSCETNGTKEAKKACFFTYLATAMTAQINRDSIKNLYPEVDSLAVTVTIYPNANIAFKTKPIENCALNTSKMDSLFQLKSANFEKIEPAIKRGLKVKSQFDVPIYLNRD